MNIESERHDLSCHLQRSVRYHRARERFFETWSSLVSFLSLIGGSSVVVSILAELPEWVSLTSGGIVAALQALDQVLRLAAKARDHNSLAGEFLALERILVMKDQLSADDIRELRAEILAIEAREPPVRRYLDLICHNQVARAMGLNDTEHLSWYQRTFAQFLSGDTALQDRSKP